MFRTCIGITTSYSHGEQRLGRRYVEAVEKTGALPVIVPVSENEAVAGCFVELICGLVVPGGPAVTEGMTGELPEELPLADPVRTASDRAVLRACLKAGKPVLGICYGMQLLSAVLGGSIYADVERQLPGSLAHSEKRGATTHPVLPVRGSHFERILGTHAREVNTRHLQAVKEPGAGLRVAATAPDGVIEAVENASGSQIGVQFHPERMGPAMHPLFVHLARAAENYIRGPSLRV